MSKSTKYQPVPSDESFEQTGPSSTYTQAPPSYQEEQNTNIFGTPAPPRTEGDNIPDDFKFGGCVAEATLDIRMQFIRKVYAILTVQLLFTFGLSVASFLSPGYKAWIQDHPAMLYASLFGSIAFMFLTYWKRKSYPTNMLFLSGFTALEGYTISVVVSFFESKIVLEALIFTLAIFVALSLFACQSKYEFTSWQPYLFGGLWVLILFGFMSAFFPSNSTSELVFGLGGALIFSAYILVDTQLILRHHHVEEEIAAAMSLYLDIINLFLSILRILNSQNN